MRKNINGPKHKHAITVDEFSDVQNEVECREYNEDRIPKNKEPGSGNIFSKVERRHLPKDLPRNLWI